MSSYLEFLDRLPESIDAEHQPGAPDAVYKPSLNPHFVTPTLKAKRCLEETAPSLIVLSAPGAVGKTTLARQLAAERNGWLWDLSKIRLGDASFVGTAAKCFGYGNLSDILGAFSSGRLLFVFDAFDETEILSGWPAIEELLREIWELTSKSSQPVAVLLARSDTAELVDIFLEDLGAGTPRHSMYEIDYFDEDAARDLVRQELSASGITTHLQHPQPFNDALDQVFATIASGLGISAAELWTQNETRSFVGYAPVLQAIASYLRAFGNFIEAANRLPQMADSGETNRLLGSLLGTLLDREQQKFVAALKQKPFPPESKKWEDWHVLYTPSEQLCRVCYYSQRNPLAEQMDLENIPTWLQAEYAEAVSSFLPNHPFLRERDFTGPAFRDYTLAFLLRDDNMTDLAEQILNTASFVLTPMFAHFYSNASNEPGSGRHVGYLYEAATARNLLSETSQTTLVSAEKGDVVHQLEIVAAAEDELRSGPEVQLPIVVDADNPVVFRQHLRHALLHVDGKLVLGSSGRDFEVEDVQAVSREIEIRASGLIARCYAAEPVELKADKYLQASPGLSVTKRGEGVLSVNWPGAQTYPWIQYYQQATTTEPIDRIQAMLALSQILTWFRRDKYEQFARASILINNVAVGESPVRQAMLDYLEQQNILQTQGALYVLDDDRAKAVGINWMALRQRSISDRLAVFLDQFVAWLED